MDIEAAKLRLRKAADELGLPLGERARTYNSRLTQELAKRAESRGRDEEFHDAVFRAYFVDGRNIGKVDVLADLVGSISLPEDEARGVLAKRPFKEAVDGDWARSREMGITAVPTFVINNHGVVGAQPYEVLEQFVKNHQARKRL